MSPRDEAARFLARWAQAAQARDAEAAADLFLRSPAPVVTFSDGERVGDWLDVRVRLQRDFARAIVNRVDVHDVVAADVSDDVLATSFIYDLHVRDPWGMETVATRVGSMTLVRTKDGWRIAAAHFSPPRA